MLDTLEWIGWVSLTAFCLNSLSGVLNVDEWQFQIDQPPSYQYELGE